MSVLSITREAMVMRILRHVLNLVFAIGGSVMAQPVSPPPDSVALMMLKWGLSRGESYAMLEELVTKAPHRLSGSQGAAIAVETTRKMMADRGFDNVHLEEIMVPVWVRGPVEEASIVSIAGSVVNQSITICALGGSIAAENDGVTAEVIEVKSFEELHEQKDKAKGKIVFFNRPFDPTHLNTFGSYGGAVDQRSRGASEAAKAGAVAVLVRSMTGRITDVPHTGAMNYVDSIPKIPAAAISTQGAEYLSRLLKSGTVRVRLRLTCSRLPDAPSANVVGELRGWEKPEEVIVVAGHLDAWDKGQGAHDDGAGCVQAIEALNIIKNLGLKPRRTIRAVMFMNEENGTRGARAYPVAPERAGETHVGAIESDRGGHTPRGITVHGDSLLHARTLRWQPLFELLDAGRIRPGYSGVDIAPLVEKGVPGYGLDPDNHRYFDYHHSDNDTLDKVNPRELELGAIVEALLCWLISEEGL